MDGCDMFKIFKRRYAATPVYWKILGDALLYGCTGSAIPTIIKQDTYLSIGLVIAGVIGFFLSNLPVEEKKNDVK
jgi:hypothetical protein